MTKNEVLALHQAQLECCRASALEERAERTRLLGAIDAERPRLVEAAGRDQSDESKGRAVLQLAALDAKRAALVARAPSSTATETHALMGTRTKVHEALQLAKPAPDPHTGEDDEDHHHRQKAHGKALWTEVDRLVKNAGLT